jgi:outer membrane lipoprotein-sorting protein
MKLMPSRRILPITSLLAVLALALSSCVVKRRLIVRNGAPNAQPTLQVASAPELLGKIADQYNAIQDLTVTADMTPALGTAEKSHITEYKDVRGYVLFRKPADIRIIGLYPVVRNTAFDMVSTGDTFRLYLPSRNQFVEGRNEIIEPSKNKLENLRPQHFLDAIFVQPFPPKDKVILENLTDEDNAFYILHEVRENQTGVLDLVRTVWFDRVNLQMARQIILDKSGNILTDARYANWMPFDNVPFPKHIEINRPQDEYAVVLDIVKMDINKGLSDDKFVLNQPPGSTLRNLETAPTASADPPPAKGNPR